MGLNIFLENLRKIKQLGLRRFIRDSLKFVFHHPKTILFLCYIRYFRYRIVERYHGLANPFKIIRVDPKNITHAKFSINKYLDTGKICDGDWDINTTEYDASRKHQMVVQRFVEGKAWEEIDGFKEELEALFERQNSSGRDALT